MSGNLGYGVLAKLSEVRLRLQEVEGILATPEATNVILRMHTSSADLVARYENDRSKAEPTDTLPLITANSSLGRLPRPDG